MARCRQREAAQSSSEERSSLMPYRLGPTPPSDASVLESLGKGPAWWQLLKRGQLNHGDPDEIIIPELYLQAAGELFALTLAGCWAITLRYNPAVIERNLLKDVVGYNNVCVGFDAPPARYVAVPMFTIVSFLAIRYVRLDSLRAQLQIIDADEAYKIAEWQYWLTRVANTLYAVFMCGLSLLLVVTPDVDRGWHTVGYVGIIVFNWLVIVANYVEAKERALSSDLWLAIFSAFSVLVPLLGSLDFDAYDLAACERAACPPPLLGARRDARTAAACPVAAILAESARAACEQPPAVPAWLLCVCDYGFVATLALTVVFLPKAPPIHVDYELRPIAHQEVDVAAAAKVTSRWRRVKHAVTVPRKFVGGGPRTRSGGAAL